MQNFDEILIIYSKFSSTDQLADGLMIKLNYLFFNFILYNIRTNSKSQLTSKKFEEIVPPLHFKFEN